MERKPASKLCSSVSSFPLLLSSAVEFSQVGKLAIFSPGAFVIKNCIVSVVEKSQISAQGMVPRVEDRGKIQSV